MKKQTLTALLLKYDMKKVADKLLEIPRHKPEDLGRALHSKLRLVKSDKK